MSLSVNLNLEKCVIPFPTWRRAKVIRGSANVISPLRMCSRQIGEYLPLDNCGCLFFLTEVLYVDGPTCSVLARDYQLWHFIAPCRAQRRSPGRRPGRIAASFGISLTQSDH